MIWSNVWSAPNRWLAYYLRRQGWVVFYLDPQARACNTVCWLSLYEEGRCVRVNQGRADESGPLEMPRTK